MSTNMMMMMSRYSLPEPLDTGSSIEQPRMVLLHYEDRKLLTALSPQFKDVKADVIRLFYISNDLDVRISAKHPLLGDEKAEIDPHVWPWIVDQITALWVSTYPMPVVRLNVEYYNGLRSKQGDITATPYSTVLEIREKASHVFHPGSDLTFPSHAWFEKTLLSDEQTLLYYNIRDGCKIRVIEEPPNRVVEVKKKKK
ncbi:hypothetical protein M408DRAFT_20810 [Serendipita vermifera MAFF 305830]|uniref:Ubiquitin-like domain-containing protein n=1 Tax=Serendipita vermifera MAFF 305830 TaxID=933852 RepID=A0A0C3BJ95_SERVB|nr:hypothetical protein M408DRAFT_20810 [Serendipita vermifera MAFF 305830]